MLQKGQIWLLEPGFLIENGLERNQMMPKSIYNITTVFKYMQM